MKKIKIIISVLILICISVSCYKTPLSNIKNAVVVEKNKNSRKIEVVEFNYFPEQNEYRYIFQSYRLCTYEFNKIQVGDSINYSKNIIVNQR